MNLLDYFILVVLVFFVGLGLYKGFIKSVFSTLGLIAGVLLAYKLSPTITNYLWKTMPTFNGAENLVFIIVFVITYMLFRLLGNIVTTGTKMVALGSVNSVLGGIIGLAKALLILMVLAYSYLFVIEVSQITPHQLATQSILLPKILEILNFATRLL
jgi:membrane protein required for colicin V production